MKKVSIVFIIFLLSSCVVTELKNSQGSFLSKEIVENYFGKEVKDPYRSIENIDDTIVKSWFRKQSEYANRTLNKIEGRDNLLKKLLGFTNRKTERLKKVVITEDQQYFYLKHNKKKDKYELFYRKRFDATEEFIYSPINYEKDLDRDYTINYINPSWDGKKVAVAMSYKGKELSDVIIVDVDTKKILPEVITQAWPRSFFGINWLPDNSGFTYLYFPENDPNNEEFKNNSASVLYKLGSNPNNRKIIFGNITHPKIVSKPRDFPSTKINSSKDQYIIGYLAGVDNFWEAYYAKIEDLDKKNVPWKLLHSKNDKVYRRVSQFNGDEFIYKSAKETSNFQISKTSLNQLNFNNATILVDAKKDEVIHDFIVSKDGLMFSTLKNGVEANLYKLERIGVEKKIKLPNKSGEIEFYGLNKENSKLNISLGGWLNDIIDYQFDIKKEVFIEQDLVKNVNFPEFKEIVVEEIEVPSHDGILVPLTILYNKNLKKNGKTPVLIRGYGAYGDFYSVYLSPTYLSYVSEGGMLAVAHVRGGGEKGDAWHKGGYKTTKPNTWKDLIACTEYLIDERFTSPKKVAIMSQSAGGIMIGRAMTERPDLFAAVIGKVGQMNPIRSESRKGNSKSNNKEYGTIKDSIECMALIEMDPYLNIKDKGVNYPATLLTAGANDTRIPAWVPGKFAARLKASDTKSPVLFQVDYNSGHHGADSDYEYYKQWANIFSFAFWQTGHPDYQLKNNE